MKDVLLALFVGAIFLYVLRIMNRFDHLIVEIRKSNRENKAK